MAAPTEIPAGLLVLFVGADDCLVKPVSARRLMAHVMAVVRRSLAASERDEPVALTVGPLIVDSYRRQARVGDRPVDLTPP